MVQSKVRAARNRTISLTPEEIPSLEQGLTVLTAPASVEEISNRVIHQDTFECLDLLPDAFVDLLFVDPPYNLSKAFNSTQFKETSDENYEKWMDRWLGKTVRLLKPDASIYVCCDWKSSPVVYYLLKKYFLVRNRITWEREKGRGAKANWKNCSEDIWFATCSDSYDFDPDAVKVKRRVIAPYRDDEGKPKDWEEGQDGNYRLTHSSNFWTDISIPFWSMPENTEHPAQKPEKLAAKIILASSRVGDLVFDPFLGSGTTAVAAKKLGRAFCGIEIDRQYCLISEKRLRKAEDDTAIQGYAEGVFWERNSLREQKAQRRKGRNMPRMLDR